jgi:hypothetical protein
MELSCIPADSFHLAPFPGVKQSDLETTFENCEDNLFYQALEHISKCKSTTSFHKLKARRKLLSGYFLADSLHRVAWRSQLAPISSKKFSDLSGDYNSRKLNMAYFQVRVCVREREM